MTLRPLANNKQWGGGKAMQQLYTQMGEKTRYFAVTSRLHVST